MADLVEQRVGSQLRRFERDPLTGEAPILYLKLFKSDRRFVGGGRCPARTRESYLLEIMDGPLVKRSATLVSAAYT